MSLLFLLLFLIQRLIFKRARAENYSLETIKNKPKRISMKDIGERGVLFVLRCIGLADKRGRVHTG